MKLTTETAAATAGNPVAPVALTRVKAFGRRERFRIIEFRNASGSKSYRVTGTNRQGKQIRENFADQQAAQCRQVELLADWLGRQNDETALRATKLTDTQLRIAESAFVRLNADDEMLLAVDHWLRHGKQNSVEESPRLDEAVSSFRTWLDTSHLRPRTRDNLRVRLNVFAGLVGNLRVCDLTPEIIDSYLDKRNVSPASKDNDRRSISRFFSWCMDRKRRWAANNPCHAVKVEKGKNGEPEILTLPECEKLLRTAERLKGGKLVPYASACLFGGLRPSEAQRLDWSAVNLVDREIRLDSTQTKTGRPRVVVICDTFAAWLRAYEGRPFFPPNWRKDFRQLKREAGYGTPTPKHPHLKQWTEDVMRHTAISHYFRKTGSYGQTAEQFGNSGAIIKNHYQGRVSSEETKKF